MTGDEQLQVSLLALLPKGGEPVQAAALAALTASAEERVVEVLSAALRVGLVRFDAASCCFAAIKQGDAL
ncbi:hypothetical protein [Variovorax sp. PAMC26660]|uniref:hypothetical protein n=1 Tax=Variovorax sp. PAMC26660 TaxID=2762322 RepID=UPI00164D8737|nr:hypothetical protein [Variovorax sp. PAMC26660]QNK69221.1 hypothetical protein H7F35_05785 [Variovorax sp. PAMC26660]